MKRIILIAGIVISLAAAHAVFAQMAQGVISYETSINLHRNLPPERQDMKSMIPEYRTTKEQLMFNETESLYKPVEEDEEQELGGGGMRMRMMRPQSEMYTSSNTMERLAQQDFLGKKYLVVDTVQMDPWRFGTETKEILGYVCRQAYYTRTDTVRNMRITRSDSQENTEPEKRVITQEITAWYTDKIRPFLGPDRYNTLPGAVLAIDINNGERVIVAKNIEFKELKKNDLKAPSAGTRMSQTEYRKMVTEQMQKMRENGRGGMFMMRN
jgi:GLPGLI family protein